MKIPSEKPANFCIAPFQSIRQNAYGQNSPCAFGAGEWDHGHLTPKERWESPELTALREQFLNGEKPEACHRCWDEERAGKNSLRLRTLKYFPDDYENFIKTGLWQTGPKTAVFKTSNICNLACRSCAGWDSSFYKQEGQHYLETYKTTTQHNGQTIPHNRFIPRRAPKHMDFMAYNEIAANLEKLDFFGGEPFLNVTHLDLLNYLIEKNLSSKMTLFYSTNGTHLPSERLKNAWTHFKMVQISFSVDGLEKKFEYLRWPGKWEQLQKVITDVTALKNKLNCEIVLMGSMTISSINVLDADELVAWHKSKFGIHYINMVQSPDYLAIHTLPEAVKKEVRARVQNKEVLGYLDLQPPDAEKFARFILWMKRQDLYRKQVFADYFPQYFSFFQDQWSGPQDLSG